MTLQELNALPSEAARAELLRCCGSRRWAETMAAERPFPDSRQLLELATAVWGKLSRADWLEAFSHHPRIGDKEALRAKFQSTASWAAGEQSGVALAADSVLEELAAGNRDYESKFGFIFLVCATGKSALEMLNLLRERLGNEPKAELNVAAGEQDKITKLRLRKLLGEL